MTARFDLRLTNQQKGAFNSRPHVEIEYSSRLYIFLSLDEKRKFLLNLAEFLEKKKKKKKKKEQFSHFSTFNIKSKNE